MYSGWKVQHAKIGANANNRPDKQTKMLYMGKKDNGTTNNNKKNVKNIVKN